MTDINKFAKIMTQCILTIHESHEGRYRARDDVKSNWFDGKSNDEVMAWVREQCRDCGIDATEVGSSYLYIDGN